MCARIYHSYTNLILALGIVREPGMGFWVLSLQNTPDIVISRASAHCHDHALS